MTVKNPKIKVHAPFVSVVLTAYNHEKYIAESIQSILDQDFVYFELIIVDDGSQDKTGEIIQSFKDSRIHYIYQHNQGPSSAANKGIEAAQSEWISLMSGDDVAPPLRLSMQKKFITDHPEVDFCFGQVKIINETSDFLKNHPAITLFNQHRPHMPEGQGKFFYSMFMHSNSLNAVTALFKKSCWSHVGGFLLTSQQLQDYFLWLNFLKNFKIGFINDVLIYYRIRDNHGNLSGGKYANSADNENLSFFDTVLDNIEINFFKNAFKPILLNPDFETQSEFEIEKAFVYLQHPHTEIKTLGLKKLFYLLNSPEILKVSIEKYQFGLSDYFKLTNKIDIRNEQSLKVLQNSLSWKITRPLRLINQWRNKYFKNIT